MKHTFIQSTVFLLMLILSMFTHSSEGFDQKRPEGVADKKWKSLTAAVQEAKLTAGNDGLADDRFGQSVSISGDRALIGAYRDDDHGSDSGSAYIFDFDGNNWTQTSKLTASDGATGDRFGISVSLSSDRALIGAYWDDDIGFRSGSAYIFDFDGSNWAQTSKLSATDAAANDEFGISVSLTGTRALIGAYKDDDNVIDSGSAYVFDFDGTNWAQTSKLTAIDGAASVQFGQSVSISGDRALIGAYRDDNNASDSGSAYVFDFDGSNWIQMSKLTATDADEYDEFGQSVSISGDRVLIGAFRDDDNGDSSGSAYIFDFDGNNWAQTHKLTASDGAGGDFFGNSVSLSGDRALIGAYNDDDNGDFSGSAYVFDFDGSNWVQTNKLSASDGAGGDLFGISVSLSGDRVLIGAMLDDDYGSGSGSAYIFKEDLILENGFE